MDEGSQGEERVRGEQDFAHGKKNVFLAKKGSFFQSFLILPHILHNLYSNTQNHSHPISSHPHILQPRHNTREMAIDFLPEIHATASFYSTLPPSFQAECESIDRQRQALPPAAISSDAQRTGNLQTWNWSAAAGFGQQQQQRRRDITMVPPRVGVDHGIVGSPSPGRGDDGVSHSRAGVRVAIESVGADDEVVRLAGGGERSRRDTLRFFSFSLSRSRSGEQVDGGEVKPLGKRKRSVAWVRERGRRVRRKVSDGLSGMVLRRRKSESKSPGDGGSTSRLVSRDEDADQEDTGPLLPSPSEDYPTGPEGHAATSNGDPAAETHHATTQTPYSSSRSHDTSLSPLSRGSIGSAYSRSSFYRVQLPTSSPHPSYAHLGQYFDALNARVLQRSRGREFDEDVLEFRFAGMRGNLEVGEEEGVWYPGALLQDEGEGDGEGESGDEGVGGVEGRSSEEVLLEEIRAYGPRWAREMYRRE